MATLLDYITLSKDALTLWVILLVMFIIITLAAFGYAIAITCSANKFYRGKSVDDESVQKLAMIVSSRKEMCRIVISHFSTLVIATCFAFFIANVNQKIGYLILATVMLINLGICTFRLKGEQEFYKMAK